MVCRWPRHYLNLQVPCRGPGVDEDPPFECPLDHFVDVAFWTADAATMAYRPSNFLTLPQVPEEIKNSRQAHRFVRCKLSLQAMDKERLPLLQAMPDARQVFPVISW